MALGAIQLHACASAYPEAKAVGASPPLTQAPQSTPTPRYRAAGSRGLVSLCVTPTLLASVTERPLRNVDRLGKQNEKLTSQESLKEVNPLPQNVLQRSLYDQAMHVIYAKFFYRTNLNLHICST